MVKRDRNAVIRFLFAGGANTLFGWMTYSIALMMGSDIWLALLSSTLAGIAFNFFSIGGYAFKDLSIRRIPRFATSYFAVYLLNLIFIHWIQHLIHNLVLAQLALTPFMAVISYIIMSRWVFNSH